MTIISTTMLTSGLPSDAATDTTQISDAVLEATAFVNTWSSKKYDPFDDYQESPELILAPREIGRICLQVAKAYYYMGVGEIYRDGNENASWELILETYRSQLISIDIQPTWETQAISLNTDNSMVIGSRVTTGGMWPRVIPQTAQVISGAGNTWLYPDDWTITKGGDYDDEYLDAWYLRADTGSTVEGTLRYMRTYRNDGRDYARYSRGY